MDSTETKYTDQSHLNDLRRQLHFTEKTLETLNYLETEKQTSKDSGEDDTGSASSHRMVPLVLQDLSTSDSPQMTPVKPQGQSKNSVTASTPKMATRNYLRGQIKPCDNHLVCDNNESFGITQRSCEMQPPDSMELSNNYLEQENEELRQKLHNQRKINAELMSSNHELLNQLETINHQHSQCKLKVSQLTEQLAESQARNKQLEEVINEKECVTEELMLELEKSQSYASDVESHLTKLSKELDDQLQKNEELAEYINKLRSDLSITKKLKERAERECEQALEAAEAMQGSVEEFQRKKQSHIKEKESTELQLKAELSECREHEKILEQKLKNSLAEIADLKEEISRFQEENGSERDARMKVEQENVELRIHVSRLTAKLGKGEKRSDPERTCQDLEKVVTELRAALEEANMNTAQAEAKLNHVLSCQTPDPSDSGLGMSDNSSIVIQDLREKLERKEQEIAALRAELQNCGNSSNDDINMSYNQIKAENVQLKRQLEQLELFVASLEDERSKHTNRLLSLEEQKTELELTVSSLTTKLEHKVRQVDSLQTELSEVNSQTVTLERQLHKIQMECGTLKQQLDDKTRQNEQLTKQYSQLHRQLEERADEIQQLQQEMQSLRHQLSDAQCRTKEQCMMYEAKIEEQNSTISELKRSLCEREADLQKMMLDMDRVSQDLNAKQMSLLDMEQELKSVRSDSQKTLQSMEDRCSEARKKTEDLQTSLAICQQQLQMYISQMEEVKLDHDEEIRQKSQKLFDLEQELNANKALLAEKEQRLAEVERELKKGNTIMKMSSEKLKELEQKQSLLESQVSSLETELQSQCEEFTAEKTKLKEELRISTEKLTSACQDLTCCEQELRERDRQIRTLQHDLVEAEQRLDELQSQLEDAHHRHKQLEEQISQLEQDLSEARNELHNHQNQIHSLQNDVETLKDEIQQKNLTISELHSQLQDKYLELAQLKVQLEATRGQHQTGSDQLKQLEEIILEKEGKITALNNSLSQVKESLEHKQEEIEQLYSTLHQQEYQLQQRSSQITQLDLILKKHKNETEQRLATLNASLKQSQLEAQQRLKQVTILDEQVNLLRAELQNKEHLLEEATKSCSRQQFELHSSSENINLLQQQVSDLKSRLTRLENENADLQKKLAGALDEKKHVEEELASIKEEVASSQKQNEKLSKQIEEYVKQIKAQEGNAACLAEALELLKVQKAQLESRHDAAKRQLQRELDDMRTNYQQELDRLRRQTSEAADSLQAEQTLLRQQLEEARDAERHLVLELEATRAELQVKCRELMAQSGFQSAVNDIGLIQKKATLPKPPIYASRMSANVSKSDKSHETGSRSSADSTATNSHSILDQLRASDIQKTAAAFGCPRVDTTVESGGLASQLTSLSISDISQADTASVHYVLSDPDDPDSLRGMLSEVQKMCSQTVSACSSGLLGRSASSSHTDRCFGSKAWPYERTSFRASRSGIMSAGQPKSDPSEKKRNSSAPKKASRIEEFRKNKGPLHSSPEAKGLRSVSGTRRGGLAEKSGSSSQQNTSKVIRDKNKENKKAQSMMRSPSLPEQSPNISTAIAHYSDNIEQTSDPEHDDCTSSASSGSAPGGRIIDGSQSEHTQGDLDLAARRKILTAMQLELKSQLEAADKHLDADNCT